MESLHRTHLAHVGLLLRLLSVQHERRETYGTPPTPPELYLVRDEGATFWELIGFRIRGHAATLLGALRFKRQEPSFGRYARQPLGFYLSAPPKELGVSKTARPANMLEMLLPNADEDIPAFQRRLRSGEAAQVLYVDAELIEYAFDFRTENPSVEREQVQFTGQVEMHLFRSIRGHLFSGSSHGLHIKLHRNMTFFAVRSPVQHAPTRVHLLPTLFVHRSFVAMDALLSGPTELEEWLTNSLAFHRSSAEPRSLLVPDV